MSSKNHLKGHTLYFAKLVCKTQALEYKAATQYAANSEIRVFQAAARPKQACSLIGPCFSLTWGLQEAQGFLPSTFTIF